MHVVVTAHDLYPDPGAGGTGRYVAETARRLVGRGDRVSVVTRRRGDVPRRETVAGVDVYRYDLAIADRSAPSIAAQLPGARETVADHIAAVCADGPPDLVSAQGPVTTALVGRELPGTVPRVATFHSPWPTEYRIRTRHRRSRPRRSLNAALRWGIERRQLRRADHVITLSAYMQGVMRDTYRLRRSGTVIPGGVDVDRYAPDAGPSPLVGDGRPTYLTVRRLAERMGHDRLLDAFAAVVEAVPTARLYVAGDGPLRDRLERRAAANGIDGRTTFLGYVADAALPAVYASADVFVLPTTALEGFGLATLEAMAAGSPVVGTPVGGTVEVLAGLAGHPDLPVPVLAATPTAPALAARMLEWAAIPDAALARAGRAVRRYVRERYTWERTVDRLAACYGRVG